MKYLTLKALRYGSHSVTCKLHRTCLYLTFCLHYITFCIVHWFPAVSLIVFLHSLFESVGLVMRNASGLVPGMLKGFPMHTSEAATEVKHKLSVRVCALCVCLYVWSDSCINAFTFTLLVSQRTLTQSLKSPAPHTKSDLNLTCCKSDKKEVQAYNLLTSSKLTHTYISKHGRNI